MWKSSAFLPDPLARTYSARVPIACMPITTSVGSLFCDAPTNTSRRYCSWASSAIDAGCTFSKSTRT